jgi:predicted aminopeptidase
VRLQRHSEADRSNREKRIRKDRYLIRGGVELTRHSSRSDTEVFFDSFLAVTPAHSGSDSFSHVLPRLLALLLLSSLLSGCYLTQAAMGQLEIVTKREPIAAVIASPTTPEPLRKRLEYVSSAREFASNALALPDNKSYRSYADLERPFVVWNVFATSEFSVEPRRWCFPIAGCVVYRGYFSEARAETYARKLRFAGEDTNVGGVAAYSTLGHFDDPVLNTMLGWNDVQLAGTLFHELAHQVVYVPVESEFNESFATVVEEAGLERWLTTRGRVQEMRTWYAQRERGEAFIGLLLVTRERLRTLYAQKLTIDAMRDRKQTEFGRLKFEYTQLKAKWNGYAGYDRWFDRALNNAHLVSAATYHGCLPKFRELLKSQEGDLPRFYANVKALAAEKRSVRQVFCGNRRAEASVREWE